MNVQKKSHKKLILIIVAVVCILCAALSAVILVRGNSKAKKLEEQLELGEKYLDELEYERAIAAYEEAIEIEPKCVDAYLALAEIYVEMDDYESALEVLEDGYDATESEDIEDMLDEIEDMPEEEDEPKLPEDSDTPDEQEPSTVPDSNVENPDLNNDISGVIPDVVQDIIADDMHSIWFDGIEFKILKYLDEDKMLVKFPLNNYLVQAVVPRALEDEEYIDEYCSESDLSGDNREVYLKLKDKDKQDAISFAYMQGPDAIASMKAEYEAKYAQIDGETIYEVSTLNNGRGLVMRINDYITLSEYDKDEKWLPGYMMVVINEEEQMAFAMEILEENESEIDRSYFEQVTFRKIEDSDYVMRASAEQPDYDARMDAMYQKYEEIIQNPDKVMQEKYGEGGQNYTLHFLWDFNEDNIPEIVVLGNPKRIVIIGEKNAVAINGSDVFFSSTPNSFYTVIEFTGEVTWSKCEVVMDEQGNLVVNTVETIEGNAYYGDYSHNGVDISEEEYSQLVSEIESPNRPKPRMFDTDEYVASKTGFRRSVQCLTNDYVYFFSAIEEIKPEERPVSEETESSSDNDLENKLEDEVEDILVEEEPQLKREETICHLYHIYDEVMYEGYEINEYDENGNIIYTETDYITWNFEYDFRPDGTCSAQYTYNSAGDRIYEIYYDEHGNITKEECPDSEFDAYVYLLAYDEKGNMIKKITCWYLPTEPEKLYPYETLVLSYDEKGRLLTETVHYDGFDEMPTRIYVNEYDESNNLILRYACDDSLPEGMSYKEEYDPATYTRKIYSYSSGALCLYEYVQYNENGDMLSKINYDAEGNVVEQYQYRYEDISDYKGNVIERTIYVNEELFLTIKREYYQ